MGRRDVITAVLVKSGRILLLLRSQQVGSFQGKWACVSGYIEGEEDDLDRAYTEIREETGIDRDSLVLEKRGHEIPVESGETLWVVHPFLFRLVSDVEPVLNWENTEYRWVTPDMILSYDTVPGLEMVFRELGILQ